MSDYKAEQITQMQRLPELPAVPNFNPIPPSAHEKSNDINYTQFDSANKIPRSSSLINTNPQQHLLSKRCSSNNPIMQYMQNVDNQYHSQQQITLTNSSNPTLPLAESTLVQSSAFGLGQVPTENLSCPQSTFGDANSCFSAPNNDRVYTTDIKCLRSNSSEPNLFEFRSVNNNPRKNSCSNQNQTIMISNTSGTGSNHIILKSSYSDQNLTANFNKGCGDNGQMLDYSIRCFENEQAPNPLQYRRNSNSVRQLPVTQGSVHHQRPLSQGSVYEGIQDFTQQPMYQEIPQPMVHQQEVIDYQNVEQQQNYGNFMQQSDFIPSQNEYQNSEPQACFVDSDYQSSQYQDSIYQEPLQQSYPIEKQSVRNLPTTASVKKRYNECFPSDIEMSSSYSSTLPKSNRRKLPIIPAVRRNQTINSLMPYELNKIPARKNARKESDSNVDSGVSSDACAFQRALSLESPTKPEILPANRLGKNPFSRSHSLIADDQVIDVEYDSDVGWVTRNIVKKDLQYNRDHLRLDIVKSTENIDDRYEWMDKRSLERKRLITRRARSLSRGDNGIPKDSSSSSSNSNREPRSNRLEASKVGHRKSKTDMNFTEIELEKRAKLKKASDKLTCNLTPGSADSIGSIISEVRTEFLKKPKTHDFLSDESPTGIHRRFSSEDLKSQTMDRKQSIEGKVIHKSSNDKNVSKDRSLRRDEKIKYISEKAVGYERTNNRSFDFVNERKYRERRSAEYEDEGNDSKNVFTKCRSRSSSLKDEDAPKREKRNNSADDSGDDVFNSPFSRGRNASFHGKSKKDPKGFNPNRRSSSLEALPSTLANSRKSSDGKSTRNSSVSINDTPEYFEYNKSPTPSSNANKSASSTSNGIALLQSKPTRGSLKKTSTSKSATKSPSKSSVKKSPSKSSVKKSPSKSSIKKSPAKSSTTKSPSKTSTSKPKNSDYDRDRGRSGRRTDHDDSLRKGERTNRNSEADRDASDRESNSQKDSELNRSLSNTDGNLEDRIGENY